MDKKMKQRVLKAANSTPVKADVKLWIKIISILFALIIVLLCSFPFIMDWIDGLHPYTQTGLFIASAALGYFGVRYFVK